MPKTQTGDPRTTTSINLSTPKFAPPTGPSLVQLHVYGQRERVRLFVEDHDIPYLELIDVTDKWTGYKPEPADNEEAKRIAAAINNGERVFNLTLDERYGHTATEGEVHRWGWFLANCMAIAAGYTSHGPNSRRINRHGVSH